MNSLPGPAGGPLITMKYRQCLFSSSVLHLKIVSKRTTNTASNVATLATCTLRIVRSISLLNSERYLSIYISVFQRIKERLFG